LDRGFGGIFELSLLPLWLAPIQHLRRNGKPTAAKQAERAKSWHKKIDVEPGTVENGDSF
jgi:hypothetical protein